MNMTTLMAMIGRKSVTFISGMCFGIYAVVQFPALVTTEYLLPLVGALLLVASVKLSYDNDKDPTVNMVDQIKDASK